MRRGGHSCYDIGTANVMLNNSEYYNYIRSLDFNSNHNVRAGVNVAFYLPIMSKTFHQKKTTAEDTSPTTVVPIEDMLHTWMKLW